MRSSRTPKVRADGRGRAVEDAAGWGMLQPSVDLTPPISLHPSPIVAVVATLQDPDVKRLLQELKEHPERAHMVTARAASSPTMRAKIEILYKNGLLGIATDMPTSS